MKRIFLLAAASILLGIWSNLNAQNCNEIVRPYFLFSGVDSNAYPEGKREWRCHYSQNAFYLTDQIPSNAHVYDFTELTSLVTKQHPSSDYVVDLEHLSYWEFDFDKFQNQHFENDIYFRIKNGPKKYLAVRDINEIYERTAFPHHFKQ